MSKYKEISAEIDKHVRELVIISTKMKNCSGLSQEDANSVSLLKDIIQTYNHLKKYPSEKLQHSVQNNENNPIIPSAPYLPQILEDSCDDGQTITNNKGIFSFENSDDELDTTVSDSDDEIDIGNTQESRDAFNQHRNASLARLKHITNTKWYSVRPNDEKDDDDDSDEYESCDSDNEKDDDTINAENNETNVANNAVNNMVNNAANTVVSQTETNVAHNNFTNFPHNRNPAYPPPPYNNTINSVSTSCNEFKESFGEQVERHIPLCHFPTLQPMYCV